MFQIELMNGKSPQTAILIASLALVCSCKSRDAADFEWSRAALMRNPQIELLAADPKTNVLTIRMKATGVIRAVKPEELAAAPSDLIGPPLEIARAHVEAPHASEPAEPVTAIESPDESAPPAPTSPVAPAKQPAAKTADTTPPNYEIDREDGHVRVTGPGVSIVSVPSLKPPTTAGSAATTMSDPIVCEGRRFMHLDGRSINVEGDAVIVRNGCELHITNSHVTATGAAIRVQNATVHIGNSQVKGADASIEAGDGAKLYLRGSTFQGLLKKTEQAEIHDTGGNEWK